MIGKRTFWSSNEYELRPPQKDICDAAIGKSNLQMIEIARSLGAPAKFPDSGGAVIGMYEDEEQYRRLMKAYLNEGYKLAEVEPQKADVERARSEQKEVPIK